MYFIIVQTLLLIALAAAFLLRADPLLVVAPFWIRVLGTVLTCGGLLLALTAGASLGSATGLSPEPRSPGIVKRGIYRYLRHPMYTSAIVVASGLIVIQPRLSVAIAGLAVIGFYLIKVRYEERLLMKRYPDYASYRTETLGILLTRPRRRGPHDRRGGRA